MYISIHCAYLPLHYGMSLVVSELAPLVVVYLWSWMVLVMACYHALGVCVSWTGKFNDFNTIYWQFAHLHVIHYRMDEKIKYLGKLQPAISTHCGMWCCHVSDVLPLHIFQIMIYP